MLAVPCCLTAPIFKEYKHEVLTCSAWNPAIRISQAASNITGCAIPGGLDCFPWLCIVICLSLGPTCSVPFNTGVSVWVFFLCIRCIGSFLYWSVTGNVVLNVCFHPSCIYSIFSSAFGGITVLAWCLFARATTFRDFAWLRFLIPIIFDLLFYRVSVLKHIPISRTWSARLGSLVALLGALTLLEKANGQMVKGSYQNRGTEATTREHHITVFFHHRGYCVSRCSIRAGLPLANAIWRYFSFYEIILNNVILYENWINI